MVVLLPDGGSLILVPAGTCYILTVPTGKVVKGNKDILAASMHVGEHQTKEHVNKTVEVDILEAELPRRVNITYLTLGKEFDIYITCHELVKNTGNCSLWSTCGVYAPLVSMLNVLSGYCR